MQKIERKPEVLARTGLSNSGLHERVAAGTFPKPVRLGPRCVGWISEEIDDWIAERIAERDGEAA